MCPLRHLNSSRSFYLKGIEQSYFKQNPFSYLINLSFASVNRAILKNEIMIRNLKDSFRKTCNELISTSYRTAPSMIAQITCLLQFRGTPPTLDCNIQFVGYEAANMVAFPVNQIVHSFSS